MIIVGQHRYREEWIEDDDGTGCWRVRVEIDVMLSEEETAQIERLRRVYGSCPGAALGQEVRSIK